MITQTMIIPGKQAIVATDILPTVHHHHRWIVIHRDPGGHRPMTIYMKQTIGHTTAMD
jgi:transcription initiation factor IIF auxiliary subunit